MSTDYFTDLAVGYEVSSASLILFKKKKPEVSHMEPRFSRTDGSRLADEKIVDEQARFVYVLDGEEFEEFGEFGEFCQAIASKIGCEAHAWDAEDFNVEQRVIFGPALKTNKDCQQPSYHFNVGGSLNFDDLVKASKEVKRIGSRLKAMKIPIKKPIVGIVCTFG